MQVVLWVALRLNPRSLKPWGFKPVVGASPAGPASLPSLPLALDPRESAAWPRAAAELRDARPRVAVKPRQPHPTLEPLGLKVEGPYPFVAGPLELLSAPLATAVFEAQWTRDFVAEARSAARGGTANAWTRWQCFKEDAIVGYAVYSVASRLRLNVSVASLRPRIIDAAEAREATAQTVGRLVTLHKLEPDEQVEEANVEL